MRRMGGEASYLRLSWCCPKELRGKDQLTNKDVEIRHKHRTVFNDTWNFCSHLCGVLAQRYGHLPGDGCSGQGRRGVYQGGILQPLSSLNSHSPSQARHSAAAPVG